MHLLYLKNSSLIRFPSKDYESVVKLSDGFNGADLRNVCTEAGNLICCAHSTVVKIFFCQGMFAIRAERDYVVNEDFMKAARKVAEAKRLESKLEYQKL